ncbi:flippase activity-associated protein Agl23 [Haladaptatus sp. GCM10025707]|uniref:flippase activity-associated protein Agl23 n=1 Tax=unclassified Haladaptatus TaxID=2622732 RepID=UPI0023E88E2B|nr:MULTISPECIES: flippase activity-associated protein Agl23 [unclassified Haladaptatus]
MATVDDPRSRSDDRRRLFFALVAIAAVALIARLIFLGDRVAHWDEGRVAYWTLRYAKTGVWEYRPIVHGPFLFHVNKYVFTLLGPTDFAMRLVVAIVGGLLPLTAWNFREHLRDLEVGVLGALLAFNPLLLYYSRFMRNDLLVAAFMFVALGFFARAYDTGKHRYFYVGVLAFALAFTTKESAILYPVCWAGAAALLLDHRLFRARDRLPHSWKQEVVDYGFWLRDVLRAWAIPLVVGLVEFFVVIVVFYAPRVGGDGVGFDTMFSNPALLPAVVERATVGSWETFYGLWIAGGHQDHAYLPYLGDFIETLAFGAGPLVLFAVIGFIADRYSREGPRDLVALAAYWGFVSILGYPIVTDIMAPWATINAIVPLAIPAAVGVALILRWGREAFEDEDMVSVGLTAMLIIFVAGFTVGTAVDVAYLNSASEENKELLQWAQPHNEIRPTLEKISAISENHDDGPDVLFYGTTPPGSSEERFYVSNESSTLYAPPGGPSWHTRLPLPWYFEADGAQVTSTKPGTDPESIEDMPPVVIAYEWDREELEPHLEGYTAYEHEFRLWADTIVIFVDESQLQ